MALTVFLLIKRRTFFVKKVTGRFGGGDCWVSTGWFLSQLKGVCVALRCIARQKEAKAV
jgi:hypothetical protein